MQLADISARQGLLADAKSHLNAIAARRRAKGDRRGAAEIVVRLGTIDPSRLRGQAHRRQDPRGDGRGRGGRQTVQGRSTTIWSKRAEPPRRLTRSRSLSASTRSNGCPLDAGEGRARAGDLAGAREFLDEDSAGEDPTLLLPLAEIELRSGELARAKVLLGRLLGADPSRRAEVAALGWSFVGSSPETTFTCIDAAVDGATATAEFQEAATTLQEFVARVPGQIPALLKLVEVCVDGGLEQAMYQAQEQLTDAYLAANQAAEARVIAEDLVAREPWEPAHIDRFRRALVMLRVSDPDTLIAERLSGQAPFMAHDPFFDGPDSVTAGG